MQCVPRRECEHFDKLNNYYASCDKEIANRLSAPPNSDFYFNAALSDP